MWEESLDWRMRGVSGGVEKGEGGEGEVGLAIVR